LAIGVTDDPNKYDRHGPTNTAGRVGRMERYMNYGDRRVWTDSVVTQDVIDSGLNRASGNFRTANVIFGGLEEGSADADGGDSAEAPSPSLSDFEVAEAPVPSADEDPAAHEETVEGALYDPDGERVARTTVAPQTAVDGDGVGDGTLDGDAAVALEFPPDAVEMSVVAETGLFGANPITQPIREAYDRLPPAGYQGGPEPVRARIDALIENVDRKMAESAYAAARDFLQSFAETELANTVNPKYEPLAKSPSRAPLVSTERRYRVRALLFKSGV
jgi:hypothetical protein